ncbi:WXG100 family type VII secretion target [Amycolatopsis sp. K13G38]|uniref:WXG100 family type VII secretion target n=1 Tax=Amycolatopsis acididurans TaxID=2724524 RepID=A0ABX1J9K1_9PSEU|nr:WXG100 family type VII secretion target [Amycolatopsis acididurans]NKQ56378.1 WXG100 family type VII secretion target [Amycolatopsis acididurans]
MSDPLGSIEIEGEKSYGEKVVEAIPFAGDAKKVFDAGQKALSDGSVGFDDIRSVAAEGGSLVQDCMDVTDIASDPIGWLVGKGLDFLLAICQPLQDAIQFVSGDGEALGTAADNFSAIGQGISDFGEQFGQHAQDALAKWEGQAAETAADKLGQFAGGIGQVAGKAGDISQLLQISSMVMTVIEEFIKGLLTELITWLIMIWIPALAAAVPSCGASTAAAGTATGVRAAQTGSRATRTVSKLQKLLDKIREVLAKMKNFMKDLRTNVSRVMDTKKMQSGLADLEIDAGTATKRMRMYGSEDGLIGKRVSDGLGESLKGNVKDTFDDQVKMTKVPEYFDKVSKIVEAGDTGEDGTTEDTKEKLDF